MTGNKTAMEEVKKEKENRIIAMLFVFGILALGLSIYLFTYIVYGEIEPPMLDLAIIAYVGVILIVVGILKAKS